MTDSRFAWWTEAAGRWLEVTDELIVWADCGCENVCCWDASEMHFFVFYLLFVLYCWSHAVFVIGPALLMLLMMMMVSDSWKVVTDAVCSRDIPNIRFVFASVPNSGPNSVFVFGGIVSSERIRIVSLYMYSVASDVYGRLHSVSASCSRSDHLIMGDEWRGEGHGWQHAGTAVINEGHKEVVNIRTAGAASKCSAGNAIRILIRPNRTIRIQLNSLKPLFGTPVVCTMATHWEWEWVEFNYSHLM